jgi:hypothetical protein
MHQTLTVAKMDQPPSLPTRIMRFAPWTWFAKIKRWKRWLLSVTLLLLASYVVSPGPVSYWLFRSELWWRPGVADVYYVIYYPLNQCRRLDVVDEWYFWEFMLMTRLFGSVWSGDMDQRVPPRPEFPY